MCATILAAAKSSRWTASTTTGMPSPADALLATPVSHTSLPAEPVSQWAAATYAQPVAMPTGTIIQQTTEHHSRLPTSPMV